MAKTFERVAQAHEIDQKEFFPVLSPDGRVLDVMLGTDPNSQENGGGVAYYSKNDGENRVKRFYADKGWVSYKALCLAPNRLGLDLEPMPEYWDKYETLLEHKRAGTVVKNIPESFWHPEVIRRRAAFSRGKRVADFGELFGDKPKRTKGRGSSGQNG